MQLRRYQYSFRCLLLTLTAATLFVAMFTNSARRQQAIATQVASYGGEAIYDIPTDGRIARLRLAASHVLGKDMCYNITRIDLNDSHITDPEFEMLAADMLHARGIISLDVSFTELTGRSCRHLVTLRSLRVLSIGNTKISADQLCFVKDLESLSAIGLHSSQVNNTSIEYLRDSKSLGCIMLSGQNIDDYIAERLPHLSIIH